MHLIGYLSLQKKDKKKHKMLDESLPSQEFQTQSHIHRHYICFQIKNLKDKSNTHTHTKLLILLSTHKKHTKSQTIDDIDA